MYLLPPQELHRVPPPRHLTAGITHVPLLPGAVIPTVASVPTWPKRSSAAAWWPAGSHAHAPARLLPNEHRAEVDDPLLGLVAA
jgi:hypothetical protein